MNLAAWVKAAFPPLDAQQSSGHFACQHQPNSLTGRTYRRNSNRNSHFNLTLCRAIGAEKIDVHAIVMYFIALHATYFRRLPRIDTITSL